MTTIASVSSVPQESDMESITATALHDAVAAVLDPRRREGAHYPLAAVFDLAGGGHLWT